MIRSKGVSKKGARSPRAVDGANGPRTGLVKRTTSGVSSHYVERILALIKSHPGIRPSELNRLLNLQQSDGLRDSLIKRGLIRKEKDGSAMRYYST